MDEPTIIAVYGCNFDCPHCVVSKKKDISFISLDTFEKIVKGLSSIGFNMMGITGAGEITLHPELENLIRISVNHGFSIDLLTNGWLFKEKLLPILKNVFLSRAIIRIGFSLDAPDENLHDRMRKKGSFKRVMEAISYCSLLGIPIYLKTAIRNSNMDIIEEMVQFGTSLGVEQIRLISPMPTERLVKLDEIPSPDLVRNMIKPKMEMLQRISKNYVVWEGWCEDKASPLFPCNAFSKFDIDYQGYSIFCSLLCETGDGHRGLSAQLLDLNKRDVSDAIPAHFKMLAEVVRWRLSIKELIKKGDYPICYWCYYQFGRLSWLKNYPDSPWARGVIDAEKRGIKPMIKQ